MTDDERGALRAGIGRLAWLARNTRPDLCFGVQQLQTRVLSATVTDLQTMNTLINRAQKDSDVCIRFSGLKAKRPEDLVVLAWGDSSLMNVTEEGQDVPISTQAGLVIGVAGKEILRTGHGPVNIVAFRSHKLKRKEGAVHPGR